MSTCNEIIGENTKRITIKKKKKKRKVQFVEQKLVLDNYVFG